MATGELIGCFGLTEPDYGSNPGDMVTKATEDGDSFVLNLSLDGMYLSDSLFFPTKFALPPGGSSRFSGLETTAKVPSRLSVTATTGSLKISGACPLFTMVKVRSVTLVTEPKEKTQRSWLEVGATV